MFRVVALSRLMTLTLVGMVLGIVLAAAAETHPLPAGLRTAASPSFHVLFPAAAAFAYEAAGR